jgi:ubiquinone/menaquinone biosynthesis C-methylase UbiE
MQLYARENAVRHGIINLEFVTGVAEALPFEDSSFDRVVCTLVISSHNVTSCLKLLCVSGSLHWEPGTFLLCALLHMSLLIKDHQCALIEQVLCSVADVTTALEEIHRVLKPSGKMLFLEHVQAEWDEQPFLRLSQNLLNPLQRALADGCHLDRYYFCSFTPEMSEIMQKSCRQPTFPYTPTRGPGNKH